MARTPYFARLMAIALLNYADDEGFFWASPQVIRGVLFPFEEDSKNVLGSLQDLSFAGFLAFGSDEHGKRVGRVVNFLEHQRIDKPQHSKIAGLEIIWEEFQEDSKNVPGVLPVGMEWNGVGMEVEKEWSRKTREAKKDPRPTEQEWVAYCTATWPDWSETTAAESWAYYQSVGWRTKAGPLKDWQSAARTAHGNARKWGTLQPKAQGGEPTLAEWLEFAGSFAAQNAPFPTEPRFIWPEDLAKSAFSTHKAKGWTGISDWKSQAKADCRYWVGREIANRQRPNR